MSIKRSKQRSVAGSRSSGDVAPVFSKPVEKQKSWSESVEGQPDEAFAPYSLKTRYVAGALLQHASFGRGVVLSVEGSHVVVLFSDGQKKLGHAAPMK